MLEKYGTVPAEYLEIASEATEIEMEHDNGTYLRIWGPARCLEMDDGYEISKRIVTAVPIGDNGGGKIIFYMSGKSGFGLYLLGFGDANPDHAYLIAANLRQLLVEAKGIEIEGGKGGRGQL